ncbi:MAG: acetyl-/propionyl-CoA carboxylase subunit alpha, partial [Acidipropionibacterium jensenii]
HVETQCLADQYGTVQIISTRDCSLQRRHQKLVEEAPAPFLSQEQLDRLYSASKAILKDAGYTGAGTCEFLVGQDGTISFLEVNTRLQVEHPVSEEVSGTDLVRLMFHVAEGGRLEDHDPELRGHSFEFRINAEDPGRGFMPAPGTLTAWVPPSGPGVRVDEGYHTGMSVPGAFDSLIGKLVVTGSSREQALERARRALDEMRIEGMPTVIPFDRVVVRDPAFTAEDGHFGVFTDWIETEFDNEIDAYTGDLGNPEETEPPQTVVVEVNGKRVEVRLPASLQASRPAQGARSKKPTRRSRGGHRPAQPSGNALASPMQGTIVKVEVVEGEQVSEGDLVVVLEAMKMEQPLTAHRSGIIRNLIAEPGSTVASGEVVCEIVDPQ